MGDAPLALSGTYIPIRIVGDSQFDWCQPSRHDTPFQYHVRDCRRNEKVEMLNRLEWKDLLPFGVVLAWLVLNLFILPRFGVST